MDVLSAAQLVPSATSVGADANMQMLIAQKIDLMNRRKHMEDKKLSLDTMIQQVYLGRCEGSKSGHRRKNRKGRSEDEEEDFWESRSYQGSSGRDHHRLMVEMQEQLKMQKELHLRRKELEELMRADLLDQEERMSKSRGRGKRNKKRKGRREREFANQGDEEDSDREGNGHPLYLDRHSSEQYPRGSNVSVSSSSLLLDPAIASAPPSFFPSTGPMSITSDDRNSAADRSAKSQINSLRSQVEALRIEVHNLSQSLSSSAESTGTRSMQMAMQTQQQQQIQELASSVGQLLSAYTSFNGRLTEVERALDRFTASLNGELPHHHHYHQQSQPPPPQQQQQQQLHRQSHQLPDVGLTWPRTNNGASSPSVPPNLLLLPQGNQSVSGSSQLNNQVPPGIRANNYWDNFRSFARQNRLSSNGNGSANGATFMQPMVMQSFETPGNANATTMSTSAPTGSAQAPGVSVVAPMLSTMSLSSQQQPSGPNVAQVTPRQHLEQNDSYSLPSHQLGQAAFTNGEGEGSASGGAHASLFLSRSSPPRQRRKQKINREQNREDPSSTTGSGATAASSSQLSPTSSTQFDAILRGLQMQEADAATFSGNPTVTAAMVPPMPQQHFAEEQQFRQVAPDSSAMAAANNVNFATVSPLVGSLTRSIYTQINEIVGKHEDNPQVLARIFHDLQNLQNSWSETPPNQPRHQAQQQDGAQAARQSLQQVSSPFGSPKLRRTINRRQPPPNESNPSSKVKATTASNSPLFSIHNSLGAMSSILQEADSSDRQEVMQGLAATNVQHTSPARDVRQQQVNQNDDIDGKGRGAVPKNLKQQQQRPQQLFRSGIAEAVPAAAEEKPRNMMSMIMAEQKKAPAMEDAAVATNSKEFIEMKISFASSSSPVSGAATAETDGAGVVAGRAAKASSDDESDMVEADRDQSKEEHVPDKQEQDETEENAQNNKCVGEEAAAAATAEGSEALTLDVDTEELERRQRREEQETQATGGSSMLVVEILEGSGRDEAADLAGGDDDACGRGSPVGINGQSD